MAIVLVANNEHAIINLLVELVEEAGHTALSARDGEDALVLARRHQPQLIISDVMMPTLDGNSLMRAVRSDPALAHSVIILINDTFRQNVIPAVSGTMPRSKPHDLAILEQMLAVLPS